MFGFRPDGRRVKDIDPVVRATPYLMPMRCDAQVFLKHRADLEVLLDFIRRQRLEKGEQISYMQIIAAAYVRAISRNPQVNRFLAELRSLADYSRFNKASRQADHLSRRFLRSLGYFHDHDFDI